MTPEQIKVLIVEDHFLTRMGLKMVLNDWPGMIVVGEAADGISALQQIEDLAPDVVLLDIGLPLMDGIECVTRVKARSLPSSIMMRSSHEEDSTILAALAAGADGYCLKDSSDQTLIQGIRCLVTGRAWLDARIAGRLAALFAGEGGGKTSNGFTNQIKSNLLPAELAFLNDIASQKTAPVFDRISRDDQASDELRQLLKKIGCHHHA